MLTSVVGTSFFFPQAMLPFSAIRCHPWLLLSLAGNGVLAAVLLAGWLWRQSPAGEAGSAEPRAEMTAAAEASKAVPASPAPPAFQWSQLDAPDFPAFIQNLRGIGCPEATIRDIVAGELSEIYAAKRLSAEQAIASAPELAREVLEQRLHSLESEEASVLASLTSASAPAVQASAEASMAVAGGPAEAEPQGGSVSAPEDAAARDATVLAPAAFLVGNDPSQSSSFNELSVMPTDTSLDPATAAVLGQLRQDFASSLPQGAGEAAADPSSLLYRMRWQSAQRASDELFSSLFGGDAFVRVQAEAVHQPQGQAAAR